MHSVDIELRAVPAVAQISSESKHRARALLLIPLLVFLAVFAALVASTVPRFGGPSGAAYGSDFASFYEAARVLGEGKNPYDSKLLWNRERSDFVRSGVKPPPDEALVRVGNPPVMFWALEPLAALPFRAAGSIWTAAMYLFSLLGFLLLLRWLGWRRRALPAAVFLAMPQVVLGAFYGDIIGLMFATIAVALVTARRYPLLSGATLGLCWLKPHVALPMVLLIWAVHTESRKKLAMGFGVVSGLLWCVTIAAVGWVGVEHWVSGLFEWTSSVGGQHEMASIGGLYYLWAPLALRTAFGVLALGVALSATLLTWRRFRAVLPSPLSVAWLWCLWIACLPYAHINDEMLLAFPVLLLMGRNGFRAFQWPSVLTLYLLFSCFVLNTVPGIPVNLEPVKLLAIVAIMAWAARNEEVVARESKLLPHAGSPPALSAG